jgi:hypothetical protein
MFRTHSNTTNSQQPALATPGLDRPRCAAIAAAFVLLPALALGGDTDVTVNSVADVPNRRPGIGRNCESTAQTCTLRAAIQAANNQNGTHTIRLPAGTYAINIGGRGENASASGDFDIRSTVIILGSGARTTIVTGLGNDRVFEVLTGSLTLQDLAVTGGDGGAVTGGQIGGVRLEPLVDGVSSPDVVLRRVHLHSNAGVGVGSIDVTLTLGDITIDQSTISNNGAAGVQAFNIDKLVIRDSTITNNSGGGVGLGVNAVAAETTVTHSTIVHFLAAKPFLRPASLRVDHTILSPCLVEPEVFSTFNRVVSFPLSCAGAATAAPGEVILDPVLQPLTDNGGPTPTRLFGNLLLKESGDPEGATCNGFDQRGFRRPAERSLLPFLPRLCDIGSVELQSLIGVAVVDPRIGEGQVRQPYGLTYLWRVPPDRVWRSLYSLDLRLVDDGEVVFWVRWTESDNLFRVVNPRSGLTSGLTGVPGQNGILGTDAVTLNLQNTTVTGSGPTGKEVTLGLSLTFAKKGKRGDPYIIEVAAEDDLGEQHPLLRVGSVSIDPSNRP